MRKLLEFDFSATVDGAIKDGATKIGAAEDDMSNKRTEPQGKISKAGSRGARSTKLKAIVTDQGRPGVLEQVDTAMSIELGLAWARLCIVGRIGPLGP
ncbi:pentatricopeptide repeat-containing protein [Pyrus ussuriensis x Pyrus communis]|uniref:Pentatricopeptide repeat-containing protein n=1 Tax=Pyrus ussuriensis x Pyrus communis TaxID=2448454 RepID=A0A5N5G285_9ROSA|nr:pentatricopeptide repeat-containing protein [Pyrus ussuriensis x Pyrus communis]